MAKKKEVVDRLSALKKAKQSHQYEVGAGGSIYTDPDMKSVRGIALPSLGLMELLGFTSLRDSCSILIDGDPGSSKSTLALELFNWIRRYGGTGNYVDAENKSAVDIATGLLDDIHLWHPTHRVDFMTCPTIEEVQKQVMTLIKQCEATNKELPRDLQVPFISVIDPLSGLPSAEHVKAVAKKDGITDRGHGGRDEALLWSKWIKICNASILNLPFILCLVNHVKTTQEQRGMKQVERKYNPGGVAQNYAVTIGLRCKATAKSKLSAAIEGDSYQDIWIECSKNSRGPTGNSTCVRKYARRTAGGRTIFWWDWGRNTATFLADCGPKHAVRDIINVTKTSDSAFSCKELGMTAESPTDIGNAVHADTNIMDQIIDLFCWKKITDYQPISDEEYNGLLEEAQTNRDAIRKKDKDGS